MMAAAEATGLRPGALCQLMQLREAAAAAEASYGALGTESGSDSQDMHTDDGGETLDRRTSNAAHIDRRAKTQPPERSGVMPELEVGEDVFGLAELAAKTMCELESSPAKPRRSSLRSPDPEEDPRRNDIPAALVKPERPASESMPAATSGSCLQNPVGLSWDRAYSYSIGREKSETVTAPAGARIRLNYIREAYMLDLNYWPSDASARHLSVDHKGGDASANEISTDIGNQLLSYADFTSFSLHAAEPGNHSSLPEGYVMSEAKQRSQEAASHPHEFTTGADRSGDTEINAAATLPATSSVNRCYSSELAPSTIAADKAPADTDEGADDNTRRPSPPIR